MNKKYLILFFAIFIFTGCNTEKKADEHFKRARDYRLKANFKMAAQEYKNIIIKYPKSLLVSRAKK